MENPFNIPDLKPMSKALWHFIYKHQGEKGFILTDREDCDCMYAMVYMESSDCNLTDYIEYHIKAIRVNGLSIEIVFDGRYTKYNEDDIKDLSDNDWYDIEYDDYVFYLPTVFSIAESLDQYVEE